MNGRLYGEVPAFFGGQLCNRHVAALIVGENVVEIHFRAFALPRDGLG